MNVHLKTSSRGLAEIIAHEAIVLNRYKDSVGVWTIGVGHTAAAGGIDPAKVKAITLEEALAQFSADIAKFEARVRKAFRVPLKQHEFDAAVSFDFNTGAINRASWVKAFNAGDRDEARRLFMQWRKPPEIIKRREAERDLFFTGDYAGNGTAMTYPATVSGNVLRKKGRRVNVAGLLLSEKEPETLPETTTTPPTTEETPMINTNMIHNILNLVALLLAAVIGYDWTQLGLTGEQAAALLAMLLAAQNVIKLAINVMRDGVWGLLKRQPPVQK